MRVATSLLLHLLVMLSIACGQLSVAISAHAWDGEAAAPTATAPTAAAPVVAALDGSVSPVSTDLQNVFEEETKFAEMYGPPEPARLSVVQILAPPAPGMMAYEPLTLQRWLRPPRPRLV